MVPSAVLISIDTLGPAADTGEVGLAVNKLFGYVANPLIYEYVKP